MIDPSARPRKPLNYDRPMYETDGSYKHLPAGAYVCKITDVTGDPERQYVGLVVDIIEGEYTNYYSGVYYADKAWQHTKCEYYTERSIPVLRGDLRKISACNPGLDAEEAFWNDPNALIGKYVGVEFMAEEYYNRRQGTFAIGAPRPTYLATLEQVRAGMPARPPRMMSTERKAQALQRAGIADWQGALDAIERAKQLRETVAATGGFSIHHDSAATPAPAPAAPAPTAPAPTASASTENAQPTYSTPGYEAAAPQAAYGQAAASANIYTPEPKPAPAPVAPAPKPAPAPVAAPISTEPVIKPCPVVPQPAQPTA